MTTTVILTCALAVASTAAGNVWSAGRRGRMQLALNRMSSVRSHGTMTRSVAACCCAVASRASAAAAAAAAALAVGGAGMRRCLINAAAATWREIVEKHGGDSKTPSALDGQ